MLPEVGLFCLILGFLMAVLQSVLPVLGLRYRQVAWIDSARPLALGQSFFSILAVLILVLSFLENDFSVQYAARHSNAALPLLYKLSAWWGGHEGSLLLWIFILNIWTVSVVLCSKHLPMAFLARVLVILGVISAGFYGFLLVTSNPFLRFLPLYPLDGQDLNPLLQDFGLIVHPPLLYIGYVGFAVPFAFALSALTLSDPAIPWAKWMRPWVLVSFAFLTLGIVLGSWWAYYELGWGGWWFWDPVENASFIPWLLGIALIHLLMTTDKRQSLQALTLLLALLVFIFSLIGAFLVRSGILTSVHAFASDPSRGIFLLKGLLVVVSAGLLVYGLFAKKLNVASIVEPWSRELLILISVLFLMVGAFSIFLGTLFPLIYELFTQQKISVGFPYFNAVFVPLMLPVLVLMPVGPLVKWGRNAFKEILKKMGALGIVSLFLAALLPWFLEKIFLWPVILGLSVGFWILLVTLKTGYQKVRAKGSLFALSKGAVGMLLAHAGIGVLVIGVTVVSYFEIERDVVMGVGQSISLKQEKIVFKALKKIEGPNYIGYQGHFTLSHSQHQTKDLYPEKRIFIMPGTRLTETAIDPGFWQDTYIALGEPLKNNQWTVRLYHKPFVRWIWLGALMVAMGALIAAIGRRHRA